MSYRYLHNYLLEQGSDIVKSLAKNTLKQAQPWQVRGIAIAGVECGLSFAIAVIAGSALIFAFMGTSVITVYPLVGIGILTTLVVTGLPIGVVVLAAGANSGWAVSQMWNFW